MKQKFSAINSSLMFLYIQRGMLAFSLLPGSEYLIHFWGQIKEKWKVIFGSLLFSLLCQAENSGH